PDRLQRIGFLSGACDALRVKERCGADHRDRKREIGGGAAGGDLGDVQADNRAVPGVALAGWRVEHPPEWAVAETHQRQRELAQLLSRPIPAQVKRVLRPFSGVTQLLDDVSDTDLAVLVFVGGGECLDYPYCLGLGEG